MSDNKKERCMLTDTAFPGDRNVIEKGAEMILQHEDPTMDIQLMWNVQIKVIPLITGATGNISKSFRKCLNNVPGKHEIK
jgi:hypothetical protein